MSEAPLQDATQSNADGSGASTNEEVQDVMSIVQEKGPDDELSSAILESEAERILENAKKKLTV
jgi:cell division protein FtsL